MYIYFIFFIPFLFFHFYQNLIIQRQFLEVIFVIDDTEDGVKCLLCDRRFKTFSGLRTHLINTHLCNGVCPICGKEIDVQRHLYHKSKFLFKLIGSEMRTDVVRLIGVVSEDLLMHAILYGFIRVRFTGGKNNVFEFCRVLAEMYFNGKIRIERG